MTAADNDQSSAYASYLAAWLKLGTSALALTAEIASAAAACLTQRGGGTNSTTAGGSSGSGGGASGGGSLRLSATVHQDVGANTTPTTLGFRVVGQTTIVIGPERITLQPIPVQPGGTLDVLVRLPPQYAEPAIYEATISSAETGQPICDTVRFPTPIVP